MASENATSDIEGIEDSSDSEFEYYGTTKEDQMKNGEKKEKKKNKNKKTKEKPKPTPIGTVDHVSKSKKGGRILHFEGHTYNIKGPGACGAERWTCTKRMTRNIKCLGSMTTIKENETYSVTAVRPHVSNCHTDSFSVKRSQVGFVLLLHVITV